MRTKLIDDMLMDVFWDIFTSFKKWFTALDPTLPTPELNAELKTFQETKIDVGINPRGTVRRVNWHESSTENLTTITQARSARNSYTPRLGRCFPSIGERGCLMRPYIYEAGSKYFAESFLLIRKHAAQYGTKPAPKTA